MKIVASKIQHQNFSNGRMQILAPLPHPPRSSLSGYGRDPCSTRRSVVLLCADFIIQGSLEDACLGRYVL